jgi:hypothetical protein
MSAPATVGRSAAAVGSPCAWATSCANLVQFGPPCAILGPAPRNRTGRPPEKSLLRSGASTRGKLQGSQKAFWTLGDNQRNSSRRPQSPYLDLFGSKSGNSGRDRAGGDSAAWQTTGGQEETTTLDATSACNTRRGGVPARKLPEQERALPSFRILNPTLRCDLARFHVRQRVRSAHVDAPR